MRRRENLMSGIIEYYFPSERDFELRGGDLEQINYEVCEGVENGAINVRVTADCHLDICYWRLIKR